MVNALMQMAGTPVLIIGDMVADIYLDGAISRISREAPVLVLEQREERVVAGGAASKEFAPHAVKAGAIVVDNSSAFRMDPEVPLVVPDDARWVLPLLADSDEVAVAGELSPAGLRALSVVTDGEVRAL